MRAVFDSINVKDYLPIAAFLLGALLIVGGVGITVSMGKWQAIPPGEKVWRGIAFTLGIALIIFSIVQYRGDDDPKCSQGAPACIVEPTASSSPSPTPSNSPSPSDSPTPPPSPTPPTIDYPTQGAPIPSSATGFQIGGKIGSIPLGENSIWILDYDGGYTVDQVATISGDKWSAVDQDLGDAGAKYPLNLTVVAVWATPECAAKLAEIANTAEDYTTSLPKGCTKFGTVTVHVLGP